jgi:hypothetical protein
LRFASLRTEAVVLMSSIVAESGVITPFNAGVC